MKTLLTFLFISLFLTACGGSSVSTSAPKLDLKFGGKDSTLNVKSGFVNYGNVISTAPGKPNVQTFAHTIYIANYELDTSFPGWMRKPLTAPDQIRVEIQLTGDEGTKDDSPIKTGTYNAKFDKANGVRFVRITTFGDGKQTETDFDTSFGHEKINGNVNITSVTAATVSGEVNLTEGDKSIKGAFTAKLPKAK